MQNVLARQCPAPEARQIKEIEACATTIFDAWRDASQYHPANLEGIFKCACKYKYVWEPLGRSCEVIQMAATIVQVSCR